MSEIRVNTFKAEDGISAPSFPNGIQVTGIVTSTVLDNTVNGDFTVTGNVSVGGTLTYEDVTNIDSVGLVTARTGIKVPAGEVTVGNNIQLGNTGVITATSFSGSGANLTGIDATALKDGSGNVIVQASASAVSVTAGKHLNPASNNTTDLGTSSLRWRVIYTNDLELSNKGSQNSVDGTWGDWTLQEGENDIFMINNRTGKKFKINMTEVD
tara:strand:- start:300 stop:935 length:636 start_codon:yes stop_codon:yes gene_type:complete